MKVHFLQHAQNRIHQRGLKREVIADLVEAAAPMLNGSGLRFKIRGNVVVAQKKRNGDIEVITAWEKKRLPKSATRRKKRK
ncbi:MAG: hypothetical protein WCZ10_14955 [Desulfobulbaceae bacterium]